MEEPSFAQQLSEFQKLMSDTDQYLNTDAKCRYAYYATRLGKDLEDDVTRALTECARGTVFEGKVNKVSGQRFPDIIVAEKFGVEVKSTKENHWTSTGSSILESTRVDSVRIIYLTFGKMGGNPIEFRSKPYDECLYSIAVTHMPRYLINMDLPKDQTIFKKMQITYEELRKKKDPVAPVAKYLREQLKEGESLWWAGNHDDEAVSPTIRMWNTLSSKKKEVYRAHGMVAYPQVFNRKYGDFVLWLASQGVVCPNVRDLFSAGGKKGLRLPTGEEKQVPAILGRVQQNAKFIIEELAKKDPLLTVSEPPIQDIELASRIIKWINTVSQYSDENSNITKDLLANIFFKTSFMDAVHMVAGKNI